MAKLCSGCGVQLQTTDEQSPGFVPARSLLAEERPLCRRCYRIRHYGKVEFPAPEGEALRQLVERSVRSSQAVVLVVDITDFEGTWHPSLARQAGGRLIVAVNKTDLLPERTPPREVAAWVKRRYAEVGINPQILLVSAKRREGVLFLAEAAEALGRSFGSDMPRIAVVGATNVGKSTLVTQWLADAEQADLPTVSRFPGTTLGLLTYQLRTSILVDTPGMVMNNRISDVLCPDCAALLIADRALQTKLYHLGPGQALSFGALVSVTLESVHGADPADPGLPMAVFTADTVPIHRVRAERLRETFPAGVVHTQRTACARCSPDLSQRGWEEVSLHVGEMEDLAIAGLGWISPRRHAIDVRVVVPARVTVVLRPRLFGPKTPVEVPPPRSRAAGPGQNRPTGQHPKRPSGPKRERPRVR